MSQATTHPIPAACVPSIADAVLKRALEARALRRRLRRLSRTIRQSNDAAAHLESGPLRENAGALAGGERLILEFMRANRLPVYRHGQALFIDPLSRDRAFINLMVIHEPDPAEPPAAGPVEPSV